MAERTERTVKLNGQIVTLTIGDYPLPGGATCAICHLALPANTKFAWTREPRWWACCLRHLPAPKADAIIAQAEAIVAAATTNSCPHGVERDAYGWASCQPCADAIYAQRNASFRAIARKLGVSVELVRRVAEQNEDGSDRNGDISRIERELGI